MSRSGKQTATSLAPVSWCLVSAVLFGASTPASKLLLGSTSPLLLSGVLYLGAAAATAPSALRGLGQLRRVDRRNGFYLLGAVLCGGVIGPVLLLIGLSLAPAGSVSLWLNLEGVATALLARAFFKEHLHASTWLAIALIVIASALLSPAAPQGGVAVVWVALACLAWGVDNNLTAVIDRFTPAEIAFTKGIVAGALNTSLGIALADDQIAAETLAFGLLVGAFSYGVSLMLYVAAAQQLGATRSQLLFSTAPAFGLVLSWLALAEAMSGRQWAAAALMAFAIWVWHRERHEHEHAHDAVVHTHWHRHDDGHHDHEHDGNGTVRGWHSHEHAHQSERHDHSHRPDLHHRHGH